ncbi:O-antigen ligase family protein [Micromonospora soli]|uniref:O-antigen ligase family protein n=1 Tax=Micromonospora sp. NBRC 110009 TaxID=3061627 RepID=UPI002671D45C|nr:O-antigen ligase family protein [Micromonospora sp. NBRC 110009]WKT99789.1 O-antigen ligase family protein [Micromonospora sp. NBRC 110009]
MRFPGWAYGIISPVAATGRRPLGWASWALAAFSAAYIVWTLPSPAGVVIAIALPLLVLRLPLTGIVLVAVLAQEIKPNGRFGVLTTLGHQLYFGTGKIPILLALALTAAFAAARWWPPQRVRLRSFGGALLGLAAALVVLASGSGLLHGQSVFSAVNQNARPFILLVLGLVVGLSLRRLRDDQRSLRGAVGVALTGLLVAAAIAIPFGEIADDRLSRYFVYYDSAFPAIAAAVFIGMLGGGGRRWDWRHLGVLVAAPLLVLISFRRSVWLAALAALVVVFVLTWPRWKRMIGQFGFAVLVVAAVVFAAPGFAADLGLRSAGSFELASSGPAPTSGPTTSRMPSPSSVPSANGATAASRAPSPTRAPGASRTPSAPGTPGKSGTPSKTGAASPSSTPATNPPSPSGPSSASGGSAVPAATRPAPAVPNQESSVHQTASTGGHISDLRLGWEHVRANFWTGVGPLAPQIDGFAAHEATRVYVHNELLQDWLRYGPAAPLLVILFLVVAGLAALKALRTPDSDGVVRAAAAFCLIAPLCLMTAPFLSETSRWPLVMGVAVGILAGSVGVSTKSGRAWGRSR